jgi:hypothetical protein|tara:strand:- start:263 stop:388 length:126 start_codon:yes stop_codon:yes gene_type:complete
MNKEIKTIKNQIEKYQTYFEIKLASFGLKLLRDTGFYTEKP